MGTGSETIRSTNVILGSPFNIAAGVSRTWELDLVTSGGSETLNYKSSDVSLVIYGRFSDSPSLSTIIFPPSLCFRYTTGPYSTVSFVQIRQVYASVRYPTLLVGMAYET